MNEVFVEVRPCDHFFSNRMFWWPESIDAIKSGLMSVIRPKNVTDRPAVEQRMDPLSEVFGSMRIQNAVYTRMEATAPWGFHYPGDTNPRIRFGLMIRGSALLKFKNQRRAIPLCGGD